MARFSIISKDGKTIRYSGKPRYNGSYLKPSFLEFSEIASPTPIAWEVGDYVDYPRTGMRYRLYSIPQPSKNARKGSYGGAFTYSNVQFHAATKELEIALFRDLVANDNNIHFSTSPDVATYENVEGIARRIQACMDDLYPGRWEIRIAEFDAVADAEVIEKIATAKNFALSGGTCLDALSKIYELWEDIGWIHTYENGKEVITIGYANRRIDANTTDAYLYGKGNGLTAIKKNQTNKDEFATRLYVYGSERNLPHRYYNGKDILNAESVDIRNLMLPLDKWGLTDGLPDARKAYLENAEAVAKYGVIPKIHYFDSDDAGADIYPSIEGMTVGQLRKVLADMGETKYSPDASIYPDDSERVDEVWGSPKMVDDGVLKRSGKEHDIEYGQYIFAVTTPKTTIPKGTAEKTEVVENLIIKDIELDAQGIVRAKITFTSEKTCTIADAGYESVSGVLTLANSLDSPSIKEEVGFTFVLNEEGVWEGRLPKVVANYDKLSYMKYVAFATMSVYVTPKKALASDVTASVNISDGYVTFIADQLFDKTFQLTLKQIGFDINERAAMGEGKVISMKTGMCAGRNFVISECRYVANVDRWVLICRRQQDDTLGMLFPNKDYQIATDDQFVLLDIALPEVYIGVAQERLLAEGERLLAKASKIQSHYEPMIDAKVMIESGRTLREGMFMEISDEDVIDNGTDYILIDALSIYEDESAIPTYKVTLREKRKVTYKGTPSATSETSTKSYGEEQTANVDIDLSDYATKDYVDDALKNFTPGDSSVDIEGSEFVKVTDGKVSLELDSQGGLGNAGQGLGIVELPSELLKDYAKKSDLDDIFIEVDTEMSDTSENAVANKVIKKYVDGLEASVNQTFDDIETSIEQLDNAVSELIATKAGAFHLDPSTNMFTVFTTVEAMNEYLAGGTAKENILFQKILQGGGGGASSNSYAMKVTIPESQYNYTTASEKMMITATFESTVKYAGNDNYEPYEDDALFTVEVFKAGSDASKIVATNILVPYGGQFSFDLKPYLGNGSNIIKLTAIGFVSGATAVARTTVSVTTMSLAPFGFEWYKPFVEGSDYTVSLRVLGSLSKTLYVQIGDNAPVTTSLGTNQYDVIPLDHKLTASEHPSVSGVYELKMWLKADVSGVTSEVLKYNIMCVASEDVATRRLVCINEVAAEVDNYAEGKLFTYATYNGRSSKATPTLSITKGGETITSNTIEVDTGVPYDFSYAFSLAMTETSAAIVAKAVFGNTQTAQITLKNETAFAPVSGYSFYMDAASRSNEDEHRESFVNEVDGSRIAATWTDMAWVNGMDGWTTDENGNKCLLIPAMSKALVDFAPMKSIASAMTLEMQFKVKNVSDFDEDIITIASQATASWMGVKVKPTNVTMHSRSLFTDDLKQGYNLKDEEMVHLVLCVNNNFMQTGNVVIIYVNGVKKCTFEWSRGDSFNHEGKLELGSQTADLYLYKIRLYEKQFEWAQILQNYISCLPTPSEKSQVKRKEDSVVTDTSIDFDKVYGKYNTFIVELPSGAELPNRKNNPSNIPIEGTNLYIDIVQDPSCTIQGEFLNVPLEGQGTTAMTYYRWNLRSKTEDIRITAKKNVASSMHSHKMGATRLYNDLNRAIVGANEADGRVAVYQYPVYGFLKIENEDHAGTYYYEFIGLYTIGPDKGDKPTFGYNNKTYKSTLIHMEGTDHDKVGVGMDYPWEQMTVGLNVKGDAFIGPKNSLGQLGDESWEIGACGGFEDPAEMKAYLDVEFAPAYKLDYECTPLIYGLPSGITIADVNANIKEFRELETDTAFTCAACLIYIDGEYDTYYYNVVSGTYVKDGRKVYDGLTSAHGFSTSTLTSKGDVLAKNAYIRECRKARYRAEMGQYWHLNDNIFHACFLDLIGATDNEKKNSYPYKFGTLASGSRWRWRQDDLDTIFDVNNQGSADKSYSIMNTDKQGTTMIFKGNTSYHWRCVREYYKEEMKTMMQTVFAQMIAMSPYGTSDIQKLVGCIRHYFWDYAQEYFTGGAYNLDAKWTYEDIWRLYTSDKTINAVNPLGQSLGSHYEAEKAWVTLRMLFLASMYESAAFVNYVDSSEGQISFRQGGDFTFKLTPAIDLRPSVLQGQSQTGAKFADGRIMAGDTATINTVADDSADTMVYVQGADWLADAGDFSKVRIGSSDKTFAVSSKRLQRIKVGDATASNVTTNIGSLDVGSCPSVEEIEARNISSLQGEVDLTKCPRLRRAYFGGTSLTGITLPDGSKIQEYGLPSTIQRLKLRQLPLLGNTKIPFDLKPNWITGGYINMNDDSVENIVSASNWRYCDYLNISGLSSIFISDIFHVNTGIAFYDYEKKRISYFTSTKLGVGDGEQGYDIEVVVPNGAVYMRMDSRLDAVHKLYSYKYKDGLIYDSLNALNYLWVEGNKRLDGYDLLKTAFNGGSPLNNIRVIGFDKTGDASDVTFLKTLANGNYHGIDSNGFNNDNVLPNISGRLYIVGTASGKDRDFLENAFDIEVDADQFVTFIEFEDAEVLRVLLANGVGSDGGITKEQAAVVTTIGQWFKGNTLIRTFDELVDFVGVKKLDRAAFQNCTALESIDLSNIEEYGTYALQGCTALVYDTLTLNKARTLGQYAFDDVKIRKLVVPNVTTFTAGNVYDSTFGDRDVLEEIVMSSAITSIPANCFYKHSVLANVGLAWDKITTIGNTAFYDCTSLAFDHLNLPSLTSLGQNAFYGVKIKKLSLGKLTTLPYASTSTQNYGDKSVLEEVVLSDTLSVIPDYSFRDYIALLSVKLPSNLTEIGMQAFSGCTSFNIDVATLPKTISKIENLAFQGVKTSGVLDLPNLTGTITWGNYNNTDTKLLDGVENLGTVTSVAGFMRQAKLKFAKVPSTCTKLDIDAFSNCTSLEYLLVWNPNPPTLGTSALNNTNSCPIYVPDESVETYKGATGWSNASIAPRIYPMSIYNMGGLENVIVFADPAVASVLNANGIGSGGYVGKQQAAEVTSIGTMFRDNAEIVSFDELQYFTGLGMIGDPSYETMWTAAFYSCENLEHITLPPNLTAIQGLTFSLCPKLKIDSLPQSITRISFEAFSGADLDGLVINLPNLSSLGDNAFAETNISRVENLGNIEKSGPTSGNELYNGTFRACKKLTFARLPSTLNALGISLFRDCTALETVICESTIPPTLYYGEFTGCTSLKSIYVPDTAVDTYKAASGWSNASIVNLIKPMSQYNG